MDWKKLYFGKLSRSEIGEAIKNSSWQNIRLSMKGVTLEEKYNILTRWLSFCSYSREAQIQVTNYVTALSRGGLIKPEDYLGEEEK
jgi:hypothetical protein